MVSFARVLRILPAIAAAAALAVTLAPAQAQKVGVNSAVNPDATGTPPGGAQRKLVLGQEVVHNEHVITGPKGTTQILFLDESAMSVGPNADVTIDEFVYDPNTGNGRLAMSATQGVMRFVGGKLSKKTDAVSLTTPVGTLGIRGGVFLAELSHDSPKESQGPLSQQLAQLSPDSPRGSRGPLSLRVVFLYGSSLSVTGANVTQIITRPGFSVTISGAGAAPTPPGPPPAGTMQKLMGQFVGRTDTHGGAKNPPSEASVANSGVATDISANVAASDAQAAQNSMTGTPPLPNINAVQQEAILNTIANSSTTNTTPIIQTPPPPPPQPFPDTSGIAGGLNVLGTNPAFGFSAQIAPYSGGVVQGGVLTATINNGNFNLGLHTGSSATVTLPLLQGTNTVTAVGTTPLGPVSGTTFVVPDNSFFFADLFPVASPANTIFFYGGLPVNPAVFQPTGAPQVTAFALQPDAVLQSPIPFIRNQTGGSLSNPTVSPLFVAQTANVGFNVPFSNPVAGVPKALQASLAIAGQGPGQSSVLTVAVGNVFATTANLGQTAQPVLNGTVEGAFLSGSGTTPTLINSALLTAIDSTGNSFYGKTQISGFVLDPNSCCNLNGTLVPATASEQNPLNGQSISYQFNQPATTTALPAIGSGTQTSNNLTGFAGGIMNKVAGGTATPYAVIGNASIQTNAAISQIAAQIAVSDPLTSITSGVSNLNVSYGSLTPGNVAGRQAYINDNLFATLETPGGVGSSLNGSTSTAQVYLVNANAVPNTTLLPTGTLCQQCQFLQYGYWGGQVTTPGAGVPPRSDVGAINFWVSGFQTPVAQLPTVGSGSYSGSAIGSVVNNGAAYIAAGGFNQTYNFGSQTGTVNITNFDGANYSSNVTGAHGTSLFNGPLSGPAGRSGVVAGGFFGNGANAAAETGGTFAVQSSVPGYLAGGVFAGRLTSPIH